MKSFLMVTHSIMQLLRLSLVGLFVVVVVVVSYSPRLPLGY